MPRFGVVGATGAVGTVTLELLRERGHTDIRAFASARSAGREIPFGESTLAVEEATPENLAEAEIDLCFFSVGTGPSSELVPPPPRPARRASTSRMPSASARGSRSSSQV